MDNVLVNFMSGVEKLDKSVLEAHKKLHGEENFDDIPGVFALMDPMPGAIDAVLELSKHFDTFVLSSSPWLNPSAWADKVSWIHRHFGIDKDSPLYKRLILSHQKHLSFGDFLVDDRDANGADRFGFASGGELVLFGSQGLENWEKVTVYLMGRR